MDLNDTPELAEYRQRVRGWLEEHASEAPQRRGREDPESVAAHRAWQGKLAGAGLAARHVAGGVRRPGPRPAPSGRGQPGDRPRRGPGAVRPDRRRHARADASSRTAPRTRSSATSGPMLAGEEVWCQLFSEPAAGSDLAAVQTRAKREDDGGWRVSGQKVWTTNAQYAAFGLLLARTDPDVPKHRGLTMFILPIDAEGVSVLPLRQISGDAHFNEVFLDDVRLEPGSEVGPGRRRLGRRHDHADVRAGGDRPRRRGLRLARRPLRHGADRRRGGDAGPRGPPPLRRDRGRVPRPALHQLPDADPAPARATCPARRARWPR